MTISNAGEGVKKLDLSFTVDRNAKGTSIKENCLAAYIKLNMNLSYNPEIPLKDIYLKETKKFRSYKLLHTNIYRSSIYNLRTLEICQMTFKG